MRHSKRGTGGTSVTSTEPASGYSGFRVLFRRCSSRAFCRASGHSSESPRAQRVTRHPKGRPYASESREACTLRRCVPFPVRPRRADRGPRGVRERDVRRALYATRFAFVARRRRPSSAPVCEHHLTSRALSARLPHFRRKQALHRAASAPAAQATRARSRYASARLTRSAAAATTMRQALFPILETAGALRERIRDLRAASAVRRDDALRDYRLFSTRARDEPAHPSTRSAR